jgi:uncharacterized protein YggE
MVLTRSNIIRMNIFNRSFKVPLATFFFVCFIAQLSGPAFAGDHSHSEQVISVAGSASASMDPDMVSVRFGVETRQPTSDAALNENAELMQSVIASLQKEGVTEDEISTTQFNIHPVYENLQDRETGRRTQVLSGYQVSNILLVETKNTELVATIIDTAVGQGVNRIDSVQFSISPDVLAGLKDQLIESAVLNAKARASKALTPLNYEVTGVKNMSIAGFSPTPGPMMANAPMMEMARSAPTQVFAADQEVRTTVNVTFFIGESETN